MQHIGYHGRPLACRLASLDELALNDQPGAG